MIEIQRSIVDEWSVNERKGVREEERERERGREAPDLRVRKQ